MQVQVLSGVPSKGNRMISIWEQKLLGEYDLIVIGAGIIGLTTAHYYSALFPSHSVLVLEKNIPLCASASTRNAGFACFGSASELLKSIRTIGSNKTQELLNMRIKGLNLLRTHTDFYSSGNIELLNNKTIECADHLDDLNYMVHHASSERFVENYKLIEKSYHWSFGKEREQALIYSAHESSISTSRLYEKLLKNKNVFFNQEVKSIQENSDEVIVETQDRKFRTDRVAICANTEITKFVPSIKIVPGRAQILLTEKVDFKQRADLCPVHYDEGYFYARTFDKRILVGGGRNQFFKQEQTTEMETTENVENVIKDFLYNVLLKDTGLTPKIESKWAGIMGFSEDGMPKVEVVPGSSKIVAAFGCNGMGVSIGSAIAQDASKLLKDIV